MHCSYNTKMIGLFLGALLSIFKICVMPCRNIYTESFGSGGIQSVEIVSQAVMFLQFCQQAMERFKFIKSFV